MTFSRRLARFNRRVTNPVQGLWAWLLPPWVVICHHGRRTGRLYRTPVNGYVRDGRLYVVALYGPGSGWIRNVLAGPAEVVRAGRTYALRDCELLNVSGDGEQPGLPRAARAIARRFRQPVLTGRLDGPRPGFGPGPRA